MIYPYFRHSSETPKGWGKEVLLANRDGYCGKLLCFNKGAKFSMHFHDLKSESFYVLSGRIEFRYIGKGCVIFSETLNRGDVVDIPRLCLHQVEALEESVLVEVSTRHEDSDSYRVAPGDSQITAG